ncbi:MAG: ankyrin repeat domain-containing protein [Novosphingobium sp.]|nr:ankyrin repeat domain-containing protein [Novosphingobium sp.]
MADTRLDNFATQEEREFIASVIDGKTDQALRLGRNLPDGLDTTGKQGRTALLLAVMANDRKMVKALLDAGANPDGGDNAAPLHPAVLDESGELVNMLLKAGADPNRTYNFETPLNEAALVGAAGNADRLLDAGADIEKGQVQLQRSPSITGAAADQWQVVVKLIGRGASPYTTDTAGITIAYRAYRSRLKSENPDGQARDAVAAKFREVGFPWPPPEPKVVKRRIAAGQWPPKLEPQ